MAYRNKTYVCFDATNDIRYYRLMCAWKQNDNIAFDFYNAHDLNNIMTWSQEDTIKRRLRERLQSSKVMVVLVGERTKYHHKFVEWEIEHALSLDMPIIVVNLSGERKLDNERCPVLLRSALAIHVSFNAAIMQFALENWPAQHATERRQGKTGDFFYRTTIYESLGL